MESAKTPEIIFLDQVGSTNDYAMKLLKEDPPPEGTVISARMQTSGKGRKQRDWHSAPGQNLTFSVILYPKFLPAERQFYLSVIAALSLVRTVERYTGDVTIKWPNDIYVADDKIAGILIENTIHGENLAATVLGIGINVNEDPMPANLEAVSLRSVTGKSYSTDQLLNEFYNALLYHYQRLQSKDYQLLKAEYESLQYFSEKMSVFEQDDKIIRARPAGINDYGHLILTLPDGSTLTCGMDEITWRRFA